jgi:hypothetical protein
MPSLSHHFAGAVVAGVVGAGELNFRGALGYLRGFNQIDNRMGGEYHWFKEQKCSRSAHLELIWEIPVYTVQ